MIQLLRQFSVLHSDKKQISVGFVGYPNTGKSSIINTLKKKKVCTVAPIPGETKVWQYITLMRRIYLIDCPGIVPVSAHDSETGTVLKGVVRVENLETPAEHIPALLSRVKPEYIKRTYNLVSWSDSQDFLGQLARRMGKLLKGGEPDYETCAKMVLNDWIRGKIPFFVAPPLPAAAAEGDASAKIDVKGKGKATASEVAEPSEDDRAHGLQRARGVKGVDQPLRQIAVVTKFSAEDTHGGVPEDFEGEDGDDKVVVEEDALDAEDDEVEEDDVSDSEESEVGLEELAWEDVFSGAQGESAVEAKALSDDEEEEASASEVASGGESDNAEGSTPRGTKRKAVRFDGSTPANAAEFDEPDARRGGSKDKAPRMTTSKRKAENYYTHANVKNKNRNKTRPPLPAGQAGKAPRASNVGANGKGPRGARKGRK